MPKSKILSDAEGLAERARERMAAIAGEPVYLGPFNRHLDWPTMCLAVLGAIVAICGFAFLALPGLVIGLVNLVKFSVTFWGL